MLVEVLAVIKLAAETTVGIALLAFLARLGILPFVLFRAAFFWHEWKRFRK